MKNKLPYSVPEGYFGELNEKLMRTGTFRFAPAIAVAASIVILAGIGGLFFNRTEPAPVQTGSPEDEIIEYLICSGAPLAYFEDNL